MLAALRKDHDASHELLIIYETHENRLETALEIVTNAQNQIRTARKTLATSQELIISLQIENDLLNERMINQRDVDALIDADLNSSLFSTFFEHHRHSSESFSASTNATTSFKRFSKYSDSDKFTSDRNDHDHIESIFDD